MIDRYAGKVLIVALTCSMLGQLTATAATPPHNAPGGYNDAGVQLNRTREYMERERIAREIAEKRAKEHNKVEGEQGEEQQGQTAEIKFTLSKIITDKSEVLSGEELDKITAAYLGREITLQDLYKAVDEINALYAAKGYLTCKAFLPPQTIKKGVAHISLVEGKTGNVYVAGNKSTNQGYIIGRIRLQPGELSNINELNKDLLRFNATNDVQLRIAMHAGQESGTTDYVISAYEPKRFNVTAYADNAGSKTSGEWREGIFFTDKSFSGNRDALMLSGIFSQGTKSGSFAYNVPVGRSGTKLGLQYSANSVHIIDGELEPLNVRGHSNMYGVSLTQPLIVTERLKTDLALEYSRQNSKTDFLGIHWVDDTISGYTASFSMMNYGKSSVIYQKHGYRFGNWENIDGTGKNFGKYQFSGLYQKAYASGQMLTGRLDAQWSGNNYLPSGEQFYIGGSYSVRGYTESLLGGDHGLSASVEYSIPLAANTSAFAFVDYGEVFGDSAFDDHILLSTGVGIKATIAQNFYSSLTLGIPLRRELNGSEESKTRLHFMFNGQF